jgi:acetyl esterase/lipase
MNTRSLLATLVLSAFSLTAQEPQAIRLWSGDAPGALGAEPKDIPTLTPFLPEGRATGIAAVVVCPGGGYGGLADHEGRNYALYLAKHGVAGFVLKYRLGGKDGYRHPAPWLDAQRAVRLVRARAAEWGVNPARVGIMGSSAGGHLASTAVTHFDAGNASAEDPVERQSSRPDVGILCYPVITMTDFTHQGSRNNLLGKEPSEDLVKFLSSEQQVTSNTPPCFIWHTWEDKGVKIENALSFAGALQRANVPFDLHVYQKGRHGIGLVDKPPFNNPHPWGPTLIYWLREQRFVQ